MDRLRIPQVAGQVSYCNNECLKNLGQSKNCLRFLSVMSEVRDHFRGEVNKGNKLNKQFPFI